MNNYCLYWIHYPDQTDPKTEGYIGITSEFKERMYSHSKNKKHKHIYNRINSGATPKILFENLTKEEAETLEKLFRPTDNVGWNLAAGGNIPPSRKGKVSPNCLLIGDLRTEKQKQGSKNQSAKMKGRRPPNAKQVVVFGITYPTMKQALLELNLSPSHYYKYVELVKSGINFKNSEELKEYTYKLRNENISKTRKARKFHYNQYTK
jgi:predicted GIY-YIG superfamily endonuclease